MFLRWAFQSVLQASWFRTSRALPDAAYGDERPKDLGMAPS